MASSSLVLYLLESWIIFCTISAVLGEKIMMAENAECSRLVNDTNERNTQSCSICVIAATSESHKQGRFVPNCENVRN